MLKQEQACILGLLYYTDFKVHQRNDSVQTIIKYKKCHADMK